MKIKFTDKKYEELRKLRDEGKVKFHISYNPITFIPSIIIE
jgi:hypothetical protein